MDPAEALPSRPERAAQVVPHRQRHLREGAALPGQHHADPDADHAHSDRRGGHGLRLPIPAGVGEEPGPRLGSFVHGGAVPGPVVADGRGIHQGLRGPLAVPHGLHQPAGGQRPAVPDGRLPGRRPAPVGDAFARQVDHSVRTVEDGRKVPPALSLDTHGQVRGRTAAGQHLHLGPQVQKVTDEGSAQQSCSSGHHHAIQGLRFHSASRGTPTRLSMERPWDERRSLVDG